MQEPSTDDRDGSIPWRSSTLQVILATMVVAVMGVSLIAPILPVIRETFDVTSAEVGLVITVFALPGIVLAPIVGVLADRFGRRPVLLPCLFVYGAAGTAIALVDSFSSLLLLRFLQGVGGSGLTTLAVALIGDYWDGMQRNSIMGINSTILSVGTSIFPVVGGVLAGIAWNIPFVLFALGVVLGLVALWTLEEPDVAKNDAGGLEYVRDAAASVSLRDSFVLYGATFVIFVTVFGALLTLMPLLLDEQYGLSSSEIGLVLTGASVTSGIVASQNGRLSRYATNVELIGAGLAIYGVSLAAIGAVLHSGSVLSIVGAVVVFGVGSGLAIPSMNTAVSSFTPGRFRGGAVSLRTSFIHTGEAAGPAIFPLAAAVVGYQPVLVASGGILLTMGIAIWARQDAVVLEQPA
ncbi:MFS transporter [Salinadaptatus halalkaliphilus]|uniref:MFS transporter n=1 Tax=Salinadaptatus halalkaliphilus TaxID=2419781 RepID=A0A4S3TM72_9EURY|nr:MFS transporter [Salinadaptatus halalkaliphilus]THE65314.1 MFS transporter [Salinadaptatus halalkaliphilus]